MRWGRQFRVRDVCVGHGVVVLGEDRGVVDGRWEFAVDLSFGEDGECGRGNCGSGCGCAVERRIGKLVYAAYVRVVCIVLSIQSMCTLSMCIVTVQNGEEGRGRACAHILVTMGMGDQEGRGPGVRRRDGQRMYVCVYV